MVGPVGQLALQPALLGDVAQGHHQAADGRLVAQVAAGRPRPARRGRRAAAPSSRRCRPRRPRRAAAPEPVRDRGRGAWLSTRSSSGLADQLARAEHGRAPTGWRTGCGRRRRRSGSRRRCCSTRVRKYASLLRRSISCVSAMRSSASAAWWPAPPVRPRERTSSRRRRDGSMPTTAGAAGGPPAPAGRAGDRRSRPAVGRAGRSGLVIRGGPGRRHAGVALVVPSSACTRWSRRAEAAVRRGARAPTSTSAAGRRHQGQRPASRMPRSRATVLRRVHRAVQAGTSTSDEHRCGTTDAHAGVTAPGPARLDQRDAGDKRGEREQRQPQRAHSSGRPARAGR